MYCVVEPYFSESMVTIARDLDLRASEIAERRAVIDEKRRERASVDVMNCNLEAHRTAQIKLADEETDLNRSELRLLREILEKYPPLVEAERAAYLRRCSEAHDGLAAHIKTAIEALGFPKAPIPGKPGSSFTHSEFLTRMNPAVQTARARRDDAKIKNERAFDTWPLESRIEALEAALRASVA